MLEQGVRHLAWILEKNCLADAGGHDEVYRPSAGAACFRQRVAAKLNVEPGRESRQGGLAQDAEDALPDVGGGSFPGLSDGPWIGHGEWHGLALAGIEAEGAFA